MNLADWCASLGFLSQWSGIACNLSPDFQSIKTEGEDS